MTLMVGKVRIPVIVSSDSGRNVSTIPAHREDSLAPDASECFLLFGALSVKLFPVLLLPFA